MLNVFHPFLPQTCISISAEFNFKVGGIKWALDAGATNRDAFFFCDSDHLSPANQHLFPPFPPPFCFWFLSFVNLSSVFHSVHLCLSFTVPLSWLQLDPSSAVYRRGVPRAPAEGDILTVSCYTANKRTFLNDELLLCKCPLTDTVSARQTPEVQSTAAAEAAAVIVIIFMIAGTSERGEERGEVTGRLRWMSRSVYRTVTDPRMENIASAVVVNGLTLCSVFQTHSCSRWRSCW